MSRKIVSRTVRIPEGLDVSLKVIAARGGLDKSDLYELGAVIVLMIAEKGLPCPELGFRLQHYNPRAMQILNKILAKKLVVEG